ncbi:MAG: ABC transporter ATP-binding protein [Desulfovibrio sp.]|nr:ABC transporter ATP-binding protein [Desulfovibrio sp.]
MDRPLLQLDQLCVDFAHDGGWLPAVRQVSLGLPAASITCLVGESGCGKSLTARAILGLTPDTARISGKVLFEGHDLLTLPAAQLRCIRGRRIGMVFQEPMTALNPVLRVGLQAAEPLRLHLGMRKAEARRRVEELFAQVGIPAPHSRYDDYPHQLSGGMRQRVMIAMALACAPSLLLADEPTTALDATIQSQILRLLRGQSEERGMAILLITHDLGVVAQMGALVGVMYAGCLVEKAPARQLFADPLHPYTRGLLAAMPSRNSAGLRRLPAIEGTVPSLQAMPPGCPYQPRCPHALPCCAEAMPPTSEDGERMVRCWLVGQGQADAASPQS